MSVIIGIDPGKNGAVVGMSGSSLSILKFADATERDIFSFIQQYTDQGGVAFLEKVSSSPQQGVVSAFSFGQTYGALRMACIAASVRLETVLPLKWQSVLKLKRIGGGYGKNDRAKKQRNKQRAEELFPEVKVTQANCDALLLAEFGRITEGNPRPSISEVIYV